MARSSELRQRLTAGQARAMSALLAAAGVAGGAVCCWGGEPATGAVVAGVALFASAFQLGMERLASGPDLGLRRRLLEAAAGQLEGGWVVRPSLSTASITGRQRGRAVSASVAVGRPAPPGDPLWVEVEVADPDVVVRATAPGGVSVFPPLATDELKAQAEAAWDSLRGWGATELVIERGWARVRAPASRARLDSVSLREAFDCLESLARVCEEPRPAGWVGLEDASGGSPRRCPYCHTDVGPEAADAAACPACGAWHHAACLEELGGCALGSCRGRGARPSAAPRIV